MKTQHLKIGVIMCTWKRISKLKQTLRLLNLQDNLNFKFHIWNNNRSIKSDIDEIISSENYKFSIEVYHSDENVGGIGRFYYAQKVKDDFDAFIFIDDDQTFDRTMIDRFINAFEENKLKSRWAWRFIGEKYHTRQKVSLGCKKVHYCGTGGMVVPSKVFNSQEVFNIPKEYQFIEDLWLSYVCDKVLGMTLESIKDDGFIMQVADGKDQYNKLKGKKDDFMKYLRTVKNWEI